MSQIITYRSVVVRDGRDWIEGELCGQRAAICPLDWRWRSAQPGDVWQPRRGKAGVTVEIKTAIGARRDLICDEIVVRQHHNADKCALVTLADGRQATIKWASLKRHWRPTIEREAPPRKRESR